MKNIQWILLVALLASCDDGNTSGIDADYRKLRVQRLELSDRAGKSVATLSAEPGPSGAPLIVIRNARGAVVQTLELERAKAE